MHAQLPSAAWSYQSGISVDGAVHDDDRREKSQACEGRNMGIFRYRGIQKEGNCCPSEPKMKSNLIAQALEDDFDQYRLEWPQMLLPSNPTRASL